MLAIFTLPLVANPASSFRTTIALPCSVVPCLSGANPLRATSNSMAVPKLGTTLLRMYVPRLLKSRV